MSLSLSITVVVALGFAPPLLWLWFWLKEDARPEPRKEIMIVFLAGMAMVLVAYIAQALAAWLLLIIDRGSISLSESLAMRPSYQTYSASVRIIAIIGFALIEELAKFGAAFFTALHSKYFDEPVDAMIYVMTASLGFAALENALFISQAAHQIQEALVVGAFRFANAVLIHASTGAIIGAGFAFSFCKQGSRVGYALLSLGAATAVHGIYNFFVLAGLDNPAYQSRATITVIGGAVIALLLFERAQRLRARCENEIIA
ncbi:MAG TPA: PrsW family glutamic-type intramembrane protease [Candidatus Paceibacterota bacterium]